MALVLSLQSSWVPHAAGWGVVPSGVTETQKQGR